MTETRAPRLVPMQVCFVVDDVPGTAAVCQARFGWGPFHQFTTRVEDARYQGWQGLRVNDIALGMAGGVQVELVHVHEGREAIADYQGLYGSGFQHLGIACRSRDAAIEHLEQLGGRLADQYEHQGIRLAFVDVPTGPAMFELLQFPPPGEGDAGIEASAAAQEDREAFEIDRATLVTRDMEEALRFHGAAFGWEAPEAAAETLRFEGRERRARRFLARAGKLELEILEVDAEGADPYAAHLRRGAHGLVHAGGPRTHDLPEPVGQGEWLERGERFTLHAWPGGVLQVRQPSA